MRQRILLLNLAVVLLFGLGFWQFGRGLYLMAKAQLAQVLLEHAWEKTLAGDPDARPWPWADTHPVARIRVPNLGIDQIVLSGSSGRNLAFGPTFQLASYQPGEGTTILSGHRDTHFKFLKDVQPGDMIFVETPEGLEYSYEVSQTEIADIRNSQLRLDDTDRLVLVTCYPFNVLAASGPLRYVVTAKPLLFASR
ncbi:MAG: class GN sortase [Trueperaceae bacterium]|nr:class GN sortase [Trueperaceae bacterium]